jgi:uncharacterized Zn-finger protein
MQSVTRDRHWLPCGPDHRCWRSNRVIPMSDSAKWVCPYCTIINLYTKEKQSWETGKHFIRSNVASIHSRQCSTTTTTLNVHPSIYPSYGNSNKNWIHMVFTGSNPLQTGASILVINWIGGLFVSGSVGRKGIEQRGERKRQDVNVPHFDMTLGKTTVSPFSSSVVSKLSSLPAAKRSKRIPSDTWTTDWK